MTQVPIDAAIIGREGSWGFPLWPLILVAFVVLILTLDASFLTPDQRIELSLQSGMYP